MVLSLFSLVEHAMVGGLIVMVMFSGYEYFVSKIDLENETDKVDLLGKLDSGSLKQKVSASIVAISSIHLLKKFMAAENVDDDKMMWYVIVHLTFVVSALGMSYVDKLNKA